MTKPFININLNLKTLYYRSLRQHKLLTHTAYVAKNKLSRCETYCHFIIQSEIHNYNTRQALDLHKSPTNSLLANNTIRTQGPIIWNTLNPYIKTCRSLASFKISLKKHILGQYNSEVTNVKYASIV